MILDAKEYRKKVSGCFVGKSVGGTLGMKYEGDLNYNNVTYYDPVPETMIANDDLDLQVVNLETLIRTGLPVCRYNVAEIWKYHIVDSLPDEYGVAVSNNNNKIYAPLSGIYRNKFTAGLGGAIRSEIWACMAPGNPSLAMQLAKEDSCTDHSEDGIYAEMFLAALESLAFVESDIKQIVAKALELIPNGSRLKAALDDTMKWISQIKDILLVRELILKNYHSDNWTDVCINLSFVLLSLIYADGDFDKAICTAASLGYDGDCTCASVGAIMGILKPDSISDKWTAPIGNELVLSTNIVNMHEVNTIDAFCDKITSIAYDVQEYYKTGIEFSEKRGVMEKSILPTPWCTSPDVVYDWKIGDKVSLIALKPLMIQLQYPETIAAEPEKYNKFLIKLTNITDDTVTGNCTFRSYDMWKINCENSEFALKKGESTEIALEIFIPAPKRRTNLNILSIDLCVNGVNCVFDAGIPITRPWIVTNHNEDNESLVETPGIYFKVPAGRYTYKTKIKFPSKKDARICAGGTCKFDMYIDGEKFTSGNGERYVPAFHRDGPWKVVSLDRGEREIKVEFDNPAETEFFLGFATIYGCGAWLDTVEYIADKN